MSNNTIVTPVCVTLALLIALVGLIGWNRLVSSDLRRARESRFAFRARQQHQKDGISPVTLASFPLIKYDRMPMRTIGDRKTSNKPKPLTGELYKGLHGVWTRCHGWNTTQKEPR